jgi:hypothetical protein
MTSPKGEAPVRSRGLCLWRGLCASLIRPVGLEPRARGSAPACAVAPPTDRAVPIDSPKGARQMVLADFASLGRVPDWKPRHATLNLLYLCGHRASAGRGEPVFITTAAPG